MRKLLLALVALLVIAAGCGCYLLAAQQRPDAARRVPHAQALQLEVPAGATVRSVLAELETRGALAESPRHRTAAAACAVRRRSRPASTKFRRMPVPSRSCEQLAEGRVVLESLTVVEGWTFADMRRVVEAHPGIKSTLRGKEHGGVHERHRSRGRTP